MEAEAKKRLMTWKEDTLLIEGVIYLTFDKSTNLESIEISLKNLTLRSNVKWENIEDILRYSISNGIKQKLSDGLAGKGEKAAFSISERRALVEENWKRISEKGLWNKPAEGRGGRGAKPKYTVAIEALQSMIEQLEKGIEAMPAGMKKAAKKGLEPILLGLQFEGKTLSEWEKIKNEAMEKEEGASEEVSETEEEKVLEGEEEAPSESQEA